MKLVEKRLTRYSRETASGISLVLLLGGIFTHRLARRIAGPMGRIAAAAGQVAKGNLDTRIEGPFSVAEYEQIRTALNDMLDHLQGAADSMSRFSADVAHELRTPIAAMRLDLEVMLARRDRSPEELASSLASHLKSVLEMGRLVEDLLFLARVGAGRAERFPTDVSLGDLASKVAETFQPLAQDKGIELATVLSGSPALSGDARLLERALANLVDNAFKFTPRGGRVEIRVEEREQAGVLRVSDTGRGIPPADQERLFERFWRSDDCGPATQGVGLGLSIVRAIVELHRGSVHVSSQPGKGSCFEMRLPLSGRGRS